MVPPVDLRLYDSCCPPGVAEGGGVMTERTCRRNLADSLKELRLPAVRACFEEVADHARKDGLTYEAFLWKSFSTSSSSAGSTAPPGL